MKFWKNRNFWEGFRSAFNLFPRLEFPARRFDPNGRSVVSGFEVDLENLRGDWKKAVQANAAKEGGEA